MPTADGLLWPGGSDMPRGTWKDGCDFLNVRETGHSNQVALGAAVARPDLHVVCLDSDGGLGSMVCKNRGDVPCR